MRPWLYDKLAHASELKGFFADPNKQVPVFPRESFDSTQVGRPFIVYGLGNDTNESLSEDPNFYDPSRQFFQVWVHDSGGDYSRIEDIMDIVKLLLKNGNAPAYGLVSVIWLEDSQEFSDQTFGTIFRYMRFQAILSKGRIT